MKRILIALAIVCASMNVIAQEDSTTIKTEDTPEKDTIRVGNMIIIRSGKDRTKSYFDSTM